MYDNFLTTYAFEQMAREYNARYNTATLFCSNNKDEKIKLKVKNDFEKFSHLFCLLKTAFKQNLSRFGDVVDNFERWQIESGCLFEIEKIESSQNLLKYINHKLCALELMEVVESFVKTIVELRENSSQEEQEFFDKSCKLYIKGINLIKDFYNKI